jgi:hypothetical protein
MGCGCGDGGCSTTTTGGGLGWVKGAFVALIAGGAAFAGYNYLTTGCPLGTKASDSAAIVSASTTGGASDSCALACSMDKGDEGVVETAAAVTSVALATSGEAKACCGAGCAGDAAKCATGTPVCGDEAKAQACSAKAEACSGEAKEACHAEEVAKNDAPAAVPATATP